jgi:hypothetical protein
VSSLDLLVSAQAKEAGWPEPEREVRVCKDRRFRFDYAWPEISFDEAMELPDGAFISTLAGGVALEVEGGVWMRGKSGHSSGKGILRDMEKQNIAVANGWRVLRLTPAQVCKGELTQWLRKLAA